MDFVVDEMGNCWAPDDTEHTHPVLPHPELEGNKQTCPECGAYVFRVKLSDDTFEWRCSCGKVLDGWHH